MSSIVDVTRALRRPRHVMLVLALSVAGVVSWKAADAFTPVAPPAGVGSNGWASLDWPDEGAAAAAVGGGRIHTFGWTQPVAIASLAKVMTALVVLRSRPVSAHDPGFTIEITPDDVADTAERKSEGQSVIPVVTGEELTERQALQALLLPSANNIAIALARAVSGSTTGFVNEMNAEARRLRMSSTHYTDPSGYDPDTVSTARDQVVLARAAMHVEAFAQIVSTPSAALPVAGVVRNTDELLGHDGFVGIKTGSDQAAGGCFMFAARIAHRHRLVFGVVLGQHGGPLIAAGLSAARQLANSVRTVIRI